MGYPGALPYPSPNFRTGRTAALSHIVLHTTEGGLSSALAELSDEYTTNRKSAHYVVSDSVIYQLVDDDDTAWHAKDANPYSLGIEIVGRAGDPATWTPQTVESVSRLVSWISDEYGIPLNYQSESTNPNSPNQTPPAQPLGYVAHGALDPSRRSDPGRYFPWAEIKQRALQLLGRAPSPPGDLPKVAIGLAVVVALAWILK